MGVLKPTLLDDNNFFSSVSHNGGQGCGGLVVKNTFLDMPMLTDGSIPATSVALCRARTAPPPACSAESTAGDLSPRSIETELVQDGLTLPSSPASTCATEPTCPIEELPVPGSGEAGQDDEEQPLARDVPWALQVRRTFLHYSWSGPCLRRSSSTPDLSRPAEATPESTPSSPSLWHAPAPAMTCPGAALAPSPVDSSSQGEMWQAAAWTPVPSTTEYELLPYYPVDQAPYLAADASAWPAEYESGPQYEAVQQYAQQYEEEVQDAQLWAPPAGPPPDFASAAALGGGRRRKRGGAPAQQAEMPAQLAREKGPRGRTLAADEHKVLEVLADARRAFVEGRRGRVWDLACRDREWSFAVQKAVERSSEALQQATAVQDWAAYEIALFDVRALIADLEGHVIEALKHPHANHVVKNLVQVLPTEHIGFVAAELIDHGLWAAKHCYGCRTVLRLVRHCGAGGWASAQAEQVIDEVLAHAGDLCRDEFGKFVLEEFLEHGLPRHRARVVAALRERLVRNAKHRHASALIEKAFKNCDGEEAAKIVDELLGSRDTVQSLMRDQFGMYVLRDLALSHRHSQKVYRNLLPLAAELQSSKQGRKLLELLPNEQLVPYQ